jgi:hypothetical protein
VLAGYPHLVLLSMARLAGLKARMVGNVPLFIGKCEGKKSSASNADQTGTKESSAPTIACIHTGTSLERFSNSTNVTRLFYCISRQQSTANNWIK